MLSSNLQDDLAMAAQLGERAVYLQCRSASDLDSLARGLAALLPQPVDIFKFGGDFLRRGEGDRLVDSLMAGRTVLFVHAGDSRLPSSFPDSWDRYLEHPRGTTVTVARNLTLRPRHGEFEPGFLACLQVSDEPGSAIHRALVRPLCLEEVGDLELAGQGAAESVTSAGVSLAELGVTMKEICLLHHRDPPGTPRLPLIEELNKESGAFTWTALQELIRSRSNKWMLDSLRAKRRITPEQLDFADAALYYLDERKLQGPHRPGMAIYPSIYDVVWNYRWLEDNDYVFRGQWNARWPLDSSLFRPEGNGLPLSLGVLVERLERTEAFLGEVRNRQLEIFSAEIDDDSLLAIAQHYGFPTPLLDYTRSLDVAAFFATKAASGLEQGDETIGVIYYMSPDRAELSTPGELENIGLPGFSLVRSTGIRVGDVGIIKPNIPDEDNRIARQKGLFVSGYRTRDLQDVAIDRIYFKQQPGEVFEDTSSGVTTEHLLPDSSPVAMLALEVNNDFPLRRSEWLDRNLAHVRLPGDGIIGSNGAMLFAHLRKAGQFFEMLRNMVKNTDQIANADDVLLALGRIFTDFFQDVHAISAVGEVPTSQTETPSLDPFQLALGQLAELCDVDTNVLDRAVEGGLQRLEMGEQPRDPITDIRSAEAEDDKHLETVPAKAIVLKRVAMACALYLASWTHLTQVNGEAARTIVQNALILLLRR